MLSRRLDINVHCLTVVEQIISVLKLMKWFYFLSITSTVNNKLCLYLYLNIFIVYKLGLANWLQNIVNSVIVKAERNCVDIKNN